MILKPAQYGRETPWHQDEAYWNPGALHCGLSVWMPLDEASLESGCMQFIPRSHLNETVLTHRHIDNDPLVHGLVTDEADASLAQACPAAPRRRDLSPLPHAALRRTEPHRRAKARLYQRVQRPAEETRTARHTPLGKPRNRKR